MCENKETIWQTFSNKCNNILSNNVHLAHLLVSFPEAETAATIIKKVQSIRIFMAFLVACYLVINKLHQSKIKSSSIVRYNIIIFLSLII